MLINYAKCLQRRQLSFAVPRFITSDAEQWLKGDPVPSDLPSNLDIDKEIFTASWRDRPFPYIPGDEVPESFLSLPVYKFSSLITSVSQLTSNKSNNNNKSLVVDPSAIKNEKQMQAEVLEMIKLSDSVFRTDVRPDIMQRVIRWHLANLQQGTHKAKTISEVSGTGKKPYSQKGTGKARQGTLRAPHMRKGGRVFGPVPRDHSHQMNRKERLVGLKSALSARLQEGSVMVVDKLVVDSGKTNHLAKAAQILGWKSTLCVDGDKVDPGFELASKNIFKLKAVEQLHCSVYDVMKYKQVVFSLNGLRKLEARLGGEDEENNNSISSGDATKRL